MVLPKHTDLAKEMKRIESGNDLNRRVRQLNRILKKNNPKAQNITADGTLQYLKQETDYMRRWVKSDREARLYRIYPDFDSMSPAKQATAISGTDFAPAQFPHEYSAEELENLLGERYGKFTTYTENYLAAWNAYCVLGGAAENQVVSIIDKMGRFFPQRLEELMSGAYPETDIEYIYPEATSVYRSIPTLTRHNNIYAFWVEMWEELDNG